MPAFAIAEIYMGLGDKDRAFPWLEKAIDERDLGMGLNWDGCFARFAPTRASTVCCTG